VKRYKEIARRINKDITNDQIGTNASAAAFFIMLSFIPCILVLFTLMKYTAVAQGELTEAAEQIIPANITPVIESIFEEVSHYSAAVIPVNIIFAMWSAGMGVLAITNGLNAVHSTKETRGYFFTHIRAAFYTFIILLAVIVSLTLIAFGGFAMDLAVRYLPSVPASLLYLFHIRFFIGFAAVVMITLVMYKFLPNKKIRFWGELPGALICAAGWLICSWIISVYLRIFTGFSSMYGSLTTIVLIMMWLYFSMYILLIGAEINRWLREKHHIVEKP